MYFNHERSMEVNVSCSHSIRMEWMVTYLVQQIMWTKLII